MSNEHPNMTATEIANVKHPVLPGQALIEYLVDEELRHIEAALNVIGTSPAVDALGIAHDLKEHWLAAEQAIQWPAKPLIEWLKDEEAGLISLYSTPK